MAARRTHERFPEYLSRLNESGELNIKQLAEQVGVDRAHIYRVVHRQKKKVATLELIEKVTAALGEPADFFPEYREAAVISAMQKDAALADRLYGEVEKRSRR